MTVYVNWNSQDILTEAEYKERMEQDAEALAKDTDFLDEWLGENFRLTELWDMTDEDKEQYAPDFKEWCLDKAYQVNGFEEWEINT